MKHAIHNASSAGTWLECDQHYHHKIAAEAAGENYNTSSAASERGTMLHTVAEEVLPKYLAQPGEILSSLIEDERQHGADLSEADVEQVEIAVGAAADLIDAYKLGSFKPEIEVPLSHEPESVGYVDVLAFSSETVAIIDYKFGQMSVAPNSPQLKIYGANLIDKLWPKLANPKPTKIVLAIVQPALHREAIVYETTVLELKKFQAYVEQVVERQRSGSTRPPDNLAPCQWCPFKDRCRGYANLVGEVAALAGDFDGITDAEVESVVKSKGAINALLKTCTELVVDNVDRFPNWTRAQVKNAAKWLSEIDDVEIAHELRKGGVRDPYVLSTPAKLKDKFPEAVDTIEQLSTSEGFHTRLRFGAPKAGAQTEEPEKRPSKEAKAAPKKKATKKKAAKVAAPKKKAAAKKAAAPKKRAAKKRAPKKAK